MTASQRPCPWAGGQAPQGLAWPYVFTASIPPEFYHRMGARALSPETIREGWNKILYLYHYDLRDVRSRCVGTELAAPLTAKTSGVFPAGFVQQDNKYAVKKQNETNVSTDKTRNRWVRNSCRAKAREEIAMLALLPGRECLSGCLTNKWAGVAWDDLSTAHRGEGSLRYWTETSRDETSLNCQTPV